MPDGLAGGLALAVARAPGVPAMGSPRKGSLMRLRLCARLSASALQLTHSGEKSFQQVGRENSLKAIAFS